MNITVFTPTYNRAYLLDRLYNSLLSQTDHNFEWLIVDDGSTDNTEAVIAEIRAKDNPFEIRYVKQQNGGKHRAINKAVALACGDLFFIVDSDDRIVADAIESLRTWASKLDDKKMFAGVSGLRGRDDKSIIGGCGDPDARFTDAKNTERKKYNLLGDKAEAYFTDILRKYPFPEFDGENFITEEVVWNAIARDGYYVRWYNSVIYICEYLNDGLTQSGSKKNIANPQGTLYWAKQQLSVFSDMTTRFKAVYTYHSAVCDKKSVKEIAEDLGVTTLTVRLALMTAKMKRILRK
ncbi:MAG: glycosyltransferase family 2 protein [Clostridiales bacterium]|nr:glycosyltransferase family 2 protein [Clostridiales bacterium]